MHPDVDNNYLYLANLTLDTTGVFRGIIHLEDMQTQGMLARVDCSSSSLRLTFEDAEGLKAAERHWDVGVETLQDEDFIIIVGKDQCDVAEEVRTSSPFLFGQAETCAQHDTIVKCRTRTNPHHPHLLRVTFRIWLDGLHPRGLGTVSISLLGKSTSTRSSHSCPTTRDS